MDGKKRQAPSSVWESLSWNPIHADLALIVAAGDKDGLCGMLGLEEIDGGLFRAGASTTTTTTTPPPPVSSSDPDLMMAIAAAEDGDLEESADLDDDEVVEEGGAAGLDDDADDFDDSMMESWRPFEMDRRLLRALSELGFTKPTQIQARLFNPLMSHRKDVVAASQTGSGKTLAFALPLLSRILGEPRHQPGKIAALILSPTRELALQIVGHIRDVSRHTNVQVVSCTGGLAAPKQKRLLMARPEIVVATPGRLWDLISDAGADADLSDALDLGALRFLVVDEADRMMAQGSFRELDQIMNLLERQRAKPQTVLLSATMTTVTSRGKLRSARSGAAAKSTLDDLIGRIQFQGKPVIIDLTTKTRVASNITEGRIQCLQDDKDLYVYYFLHKYPGRTIVFANSIACVRRFHGLFSLLSFPVYPLHSSMQQRQRLKNLDRFRTMKNCVLICTDVAARGIDIPDVDNVIHYQVSPSSDVYVHRAGRTGRASCTGLSLILISPTEMPAYQRQVQELKHKIDEFPVQLNMLEPIKKRVRLASTLDRLLSSKKKSSSEQNWFEKNAADMDIILDDDLIPKTKHARQSKESANETKSLQDALRIELEKPLIPKGVSRSFVTVNKAIHGTMDFSVVVKNQTAQEKMRKKPKTAI